MKPDLEHKKIQQQKKVALRKGRSQSATEEIEGLDLKMEKLLDWSKRWGHLLSCSASNYANIHLEEMEAK